LKTFIIWMAIGYACIWCHVFKNFPFCCFWWFIDMYDFNWIYISALFTNVSIRTSDDVIISTGLDIVSLLTFNSLLESFSMLSCNNLFSFFIFLIWVSKLWSWLFKHETSSLFSSFSTLSLRSWFTHCASFKLFICLSNLWLRFLKRELSSSFSNKFFRHHGFLVLIFFRLVFCLLISWFLLVNFDYDFLNMIFLRPSLIISSLYLFYFFSAKFLHFGLGCCCHLFVLRFLFSQFVWLIP